MNHRFTKNTFLFVAPFPYYSIDSSLENNVVLLRASIPVSKMMLSFLKASTSTSIQTLASAHHCYTCQPPLHMSDPITHVSLHHTCQSPPHMSAPHYTCQPPLHMSAPPQVSPHHTCQPHHMLASTTHVSPATHQSPLHRSASTTCVSPHHTCQTPTTRVSPHHTCQPPSTHVSPSTC